MNFFSDNQQEQKAIIANTPIPKATNSYSPVPHTEVINSVVREIKSHNLEVINTGYNIKRNGQQLIGHINLSIPQQELEKDDNLTMRLAFRNSYDKSMSVAFVAGSNVWICSNGLIHGDIQFVRKHTGSVLQELKQKVTIATSQLSDVLEHDQKVRREFKEISVDNTICAELAGRMYIEHDIIQSSQLSIIKRELQDSQFEVFKEPNLWSFYNHCTYALKDAHPTKNFKQHKEVYSFISENVDNLKKITV